MPPDKRLENREAATILDGKELSSRSLKFPGDQVLPLAHRSPIHMTLPPLASYVWKRLREKGSRMAGLLRSRVAFTSPPIIRSPGLWRLLDLTWLRQRRKRRDEFLQAVHATGEEQPVTAADELHSIVIKNRHLPSGGTTELPDIDYHLPHQIKESGHLYVEDAKVEDAKDVIKNRHLPSGGTAEPPDTDYHLPHRSLPTSMLLQSKRLANKLETKITGRPALSYSSQSTIPGIYQAEQIGDSDRLYVEDTKDRLAQVKRQYTYRGQWLDKMWPKFIQRLLPHHAPMEGSSHITRQSIRSVYAIPVQPQLYQATTERSSKLDSPVAQQSNSPYIADAINLGDETIQTMENYNQPFNLEEKRSNWLYSLPDQTEPRRRGIVSKRLSQSILRTGSTYDELRSSSLTLDEKPALDLPTTGATIQHVPEISQARRPVLLVNTWPKQRIETTTFTEDSRIMTHGQIIPIVATPDNIRLSQDMKTGQSELPLVRTEYPSVASLRSQPSSMKGSFNQAPVSFFQRYSDAAGNIPITENIHQVPASPDYQYFKVVSNAPLPPAKSSLMWHQDYESPQRYGDIQQAKLELLLTHPAGSRQGSSASDSIASLPAAFDRTTNYGSQPTPELALASVARTTEVSPAASIRKVGEEKGTIEEEAPDIDTIAHDVYRILRRRLARERERALGLG